MQNLSAIDCYDFPCLTDERVNGIYNGLSVLPNERSHKATNKTNGNSYQRKMAIFKKIILNTVKGGKAIDAPAFDL